MVIPLCVLKRPMFFDGVAAGVSLPQALLSLEKFLMIVDRDAERHQSQAVPPDTSPPASHEPHHSAFSKVVVMLVERRLF